ncbi:MAG: M48 family metallopeptidase [Bryobacteraceae bacterium]
MSEHTLIRPAGISFDAWFQDGVAPVRHSARVEIDDTSLRVIREGIDDLEWPYAALHLASNPHHGEPVRLEHRGFADAIVVEDPLFLDAWRQRWPAEHRWYEITPEWERWPAVSMAMAAIALIAGLTYYYVLPLAADFGARVAPRQVEDRLGNAVTNILAPARDHCTDKEPLGLLATVSTRLEKALPAEVSREYRLRVIYSNSLVPNAFAAPGGNVVVFSGLLSMMETPEELAGVMAHEFQHVAYRHSMRALAREVSGRTLLSLLSFDSSGTAYGFAQAASLMNLHYQRADEQQADDEGVALLGRARIRPDSLAQVLRRLRAHGMMPEVSGYLSTHPATEERAARLEELAKRQRGPFEPLMTAAEWNTARRVCDSK